MSTIVLESLYRILWHGKRQSHDWAAGVGGRSSCSNNQETVGGARAAAGGKQQQQQKQELDGRAKPLRAHRQLPAYLRSIGRKQKREGAKDEKEKKDGTHWTSGHPQGA